MEGWPAAEEAQAAAAAAAVKGLVKATVKHDEPDFYCHCLNHNVEEVLQSKLLKLAATKQQAENKVPGKLAL